MVNSINKNQPIEKLRIKISSKRQITIPAKYYEALGLDNEIECIYANNMIILKPVTDESQFAEDILEDLIKEGYSGEKLLSEFKIRNEKLRSAVEKLIEEADAIAKLASSNYVDKTNEIFNDD